MASTTAFYTGLTGLNANARNLDVIGNNIANVNTNGYKSSRLVFSNMFSRNFSEGTPPADTTGGTNPFQVGLGVNLAGTQRNMTNGTVSATGDQRDMAIDGQGFFLVQRDQTQLYTRDGSFRPNAQNQLTNIGGDQLMGFGVDEEFNILPGVLQPLSVPLGQLTIAEQTRLVRIAGNLNATGPLPTNGAALSLAGPQNVGLRTIAGATPPPGAGNLLEATTRVVDIEDPLLPASNTPLFAAGQTLRLTNAEKGTRLLPQADLPLTPATTLQDVIDFLNAALGIDTTIGPNPNGATPGVSIDATNGRIVITGNTGTANDIALDPTDLRLVDGAGTVLRYPLTPDKQASASGESVRTAFIAFDTLGTPVTIDATLSLVSRTTAGTTWRYSIESADASGIDLRVGTGLLNFDNDGRLINDQPATITIDRTDTGAATPLAFSLAFGDTQNAVTSLSDVDSTVAAVFRDGAPIGTLSGFGIGVDGLITGSFTNGLTRTLGQVALAKFTNPEGLVDLGNNLFRVGSNSGQPVITEPGEFGAGRIVAGSLELSNVDIGEEFIKLILTSTGYSANSRVIRTADELMQQLLVLGR